MQTASASMILSCPRCGGATERCDDRISCGTCGVVGAWKDELPCFTDPDYYWGEIPLDEMRRANKIAQETSWEEAVDQVVKEPVLRDYIRNPDRAAFQHIWNLPPESVILDIGAGWGAITAGLAANFSRVVAVEGVMERCRFLRTRMKQMGNGNVEVVCASFLELPLEGAQFDGVVLNGVLEWIGLASKDGNPRDLQLAFLRRVRGLLKPSGILCVGIENRIGCYYWRGAMDHSGLRYTSLMPRRVADLWCRLQPQRYRSDRNQGYRTYTYSLPGYRKLFREAGFPRMHAYHAWNGYNLPDVLLPLDGDTGALSDFVSRLKLEWTLRGKIKVAVMRFAARSGLWRQFADDFVFILGKDQNV